MYGVGAASSRDIRPSFLAACTAVALCACSGASAAPPTPDPFASVAQQADAAYEQGMQLYQQGRYAEANDAFTRAHLLSPSSDPRVDSMLQQTSAILTPSPTPAPPTPVPTDSPTPVVESSATPAADLATSYFGQVFLAVVPGQDGTPVPMARFSTQDQMGLYIEKLNERLHPGFSLRIFDTGSGAIVTNVPADSMQRFSTTMLWYHQGVEAVGNYRLELYAGDVLTNSFDYTVGTEPVAIPTPVATGTPVPVEVPASEGVVLPPTAQPQPAAVPAQPPPPRIVLVPAPTPTPEPPQPTYINVAAGPAALAVSGDDQLFVADKSGLVWELDHGQLGLKQPFSVRGEPVAIATASNLLYVVVRGDQPGIYTLNAESGQRLAFAPLADQPGDVVLDPATSWLAVVLPDRDSVEMIDPANGNVAHETIGLRHVTGLALDADAHTVFAAQLEGDLSAIDVASGTITATLHLTDVGLAGVAVDSGHVYAINTPGQQVIAVDLTSMSAATWSVDVQPAAITVDSRAISILSADATGVVRVDPSSGAELGQVPLGDGGSPAELDPNRLWQRPQMAIGGEVYVIAPQSTTLAIAPSTD